MSTAEILAMIHQDFIAEVIALIALVGLLIMIVIWPYQEPRRNVKKARVFRERF